MSSLHRSNSSPGFLIVVFSLLLLVHLLQSGVAALRSFSPDGDYSAGGNHGYRRYSIFRRQSKGDNGFRTDLGKRFADGVVQTPMKFFRDDDISYEDISELNEQKRRMFRNDLGKK